MKANTISFSDREVTKTADPARMRVEVEKTVRASKIGKECGLFKVPEVLDYNESKGIAVFERMNDIQPIRTGLAWGDEYCRFAEALGAALACVHASLSLPSDMISALPKELANPGNEVFIHGDFSVYNVCVGKLRDTPIILDWQMTEVHGGRASFGTRYFDLIWFVNNLLYRPSIRFLWDNPVLPVAVKFIASYYRQAGLDYDAKDIARYSERFFTYKAPLRNRNVSWAKRLLLRRSDRMTKDFIRRIGNGKDEQHGSIGG